MINDNINNSYSKKESHDLSISKQKSKRSVNNISALSTSKRSHSSKSKRLPKIAPPIDPKLYRVSITAANNPMKRSKPKKRKSNLLLIPKSVGVRKPSPIKEKDINNMKIAHNNTGKNLKFVSMRSFNIARMSWSKEHKEQEGNEIRREKKKRTTKKGNEEDDEPVYNHFSDLKKRTRRKNRYNTQSAGSSILRSQVRLSTVKDKLNSVSENKNNSISSMFNRTIVNQGKYRNSVSGVNNTNIKRKTNLTVNDSIQEENNNPSLVPMKKEEMKTNQSLNLSNNNTSTKKLSQNKNKKLTPSLIPNKVNPTKITPSIPKTRINSVNKQNNKSTAKLSNKAVLINNTSLPNLQVTTIQNPIDLHPNKTLINSFSFGPDKPKTLPSLQNNTQIQNVDSINIQSVTYNNLQLTNELKQSLTNLIDNTLCVYCLKRVTKPITLKCKHELCISCAEEIVSLYKFSHLGLNPSQSIKCPKCKIRTPIPQDGLSTLLRQNWHPRDLSQYPKEKVQYCEICPSSKFARDIAEFECLNCDIVICYECRIRHLANARHQDHKVIQYHKIVQEKVELTLCETNNHREPLKLYCETCKEPICVICANYENTHKGHTIKTVRNVIDEESIMLSGAVREREGEIKIINELIQQMKYSKEKIENEKNEFLEKMNKVFAELYDIIKKHEDSLKSNIENIFSSKLDVLSNKLKNLEYIKNRYDYYRNLIVERDIDIIDRVIQIKKLNRTIQKISALNYLRSDNFNKSLANSLFINQPTKVISSSISQFKFLPITDINISILTKIFTNSTIIRPEMLLNDFIVILPKIKSGVLLYQVSKDGASPVTFHEKCDNKGPTLTIVKTDTGHIFGGFNPISYISEPMYNECEDSFIFSLSNGEEIRPVKCPVKRYMKQHAIKQNEKMYSPGFGEIDSADLFISYKNLSNSYSNLGKVYKAPKNCDPNKFLAGRPNKWNVIDVEVYAIEVITEEEYFKMVLA